MTDQERVLGELNVSRETSEKLCCYAALLEKWNPKINLVSRSSLSEMWTRHMLDSAQMFDLSGKVSHWVDLGSGGGFPGLVVACIAREKSPDTRFTLIESDQRKSAFLRTVIRETGVNATVLTDRVENAQPQGADVVSARALADLDQLLEYADRHLAEHGIALFPKGRSWEKEVETARSRWSFECEPIKSVTESGAVILKIKGALRV